MALPESQIRAVAANIGAATVLSGSLVVDSAIWYAVYTNAGASADITITLPAATVGKKFVVLKEQRGRKLYVDCQFSDRFEDFPNGVDLDMVDNGYVVLECLRAGVWSRTSRRGLQQIRFQYNRTIYLDQAGSDSNSGESAGAPKKTLRGIAAIARPGDIVNVAAGTYDDNADNEVTADTLPFGTPTDRIIFRCPTAFGAVFKKFAIALPASWLAPNYRWCIDFENIVWNGASAEKFARGSDLRFFRCAFIGGPTSGNNSTFVAGGIDSRYRQAENMLFEDCAFLGAGGRYYAYAFNGRGVIFRRCVGRWGNGASDWSTGGADQWGGFGAYDSEGVEFQNCIDIDSVAPTTGTLTTGKGAFWLEQNYYDASDLAVRGCITVNSQMPAFNADSLTLNAVTVPSGNTHTGGTPPWNANRKMRARNWTVHDLAAAKVLHPSQTPNVAFQFGIGPLDVSNVTIADLNKAAGISFDNSATVPARYLQGSRVHDCVSVYGAAGGAAHFSLEAIVGTSGNLSYANLAAAQAAGLYHLPMPNYGSTIGAAFAGAEILKRIGASGTRYGEPGYRQIGDGTTPGGDLWPWPYQADLKTLFTTYGGTARGWVASASTLTQYIWGILGTAGPP